MALQEKTSYRTKAAPTVLLIVALLAVALAAFPLAQRGTAYAEDDFPGDSNPASAESGGIEPAITALTAEAGNSGLIPDNTPALSIHGAGQQGLMAQEALPFAYDSRDYGYVSGVRNQYDFGTCWAFATIASMESSLLAKGQTGLPDMSERHLAYFTYHSQPDALGNTSGDYTTPVGSSFGTAMSDPYLVAGGNAIIASHVVETGQGVVSEDVAVYDALVNAYYVFSYDLDMFLEKTALSVDKAYQSSATIENARYIAMADRDDVKHAVMEYGAVVVEVKTPDDFYYNSSAGSYFNANKKMDSNHLAVIVGWDDGYSKDNFGSDAELPRPEADGAWLIKNSWGTGWGNGGYYWLSYEDSIINRDVSKAYVFDAVLTGDNPKNTYQYDGSGAPSTNTVESGGSIANVFQVRANPGGSEQLDAIAISLSDVDVSYSIQVYTQVKGSADPTNGIPALAEPVTGTTTYAGYYTIPLPSPVELAEGSWYSVVVTLSHGPESANPQSPVKYDVDATYGAYGRYSANWKWVHFTNAVAYGQSFECDTVGASWDDLASTSYDEPDEPQSSARIKAFTSNLGGSSAPSPSLNNAAASLKSASVTYNGKAQKPKLTVSYDGHALREGVDYRVEYRNNVNAGTATAVAKGMGCYVGSVSKTFKIVKAANPLAVKAAKKALKAATLKKKALKFAPAIIKKKGAGTVTYVKGKVSKRSAKFVVNKKTGKITVKRGTPKGTYYVKVKVTAKGNSNYKSATKTATVKIRVK